jgi:formate hydrogenlyase subunit 6/NADH:ubiquinone oxidoreductase subunit I
MEKISWTDRVRNEEVLHRVKEERNIIHTVKRRKADCIGCILCRNWLLSTQLKKI